MLLQLQKLTLWYVFLFTTLISWTAVATWKWIANDDNCGICRMAFDGCCPDCKMPGDDCPIGKWIIINLSVSINE